MTVAANDIVTRVANDLQDPDHVYWSLEELKDAFNEAQTKVIEFRPDLNAVLATFIPVEGAQQRLPASAMTFMEVQGNEIGRMGVITKANASDLDAIDPRWQARSPKDEAVHFTFDQRTPRIFHLYPPVTTDARVTLVTADFPALAHIENAPGANGPGSNNIQAVVGDLTTPDWTEAAVRHYMLFRAWSKAAEFGGNAQLAAANLGLFQQALGIQLKSATTVAST